MSLPSDEVIRRKIEELLKTLNFEIGEFTDALSSHLGGVDLSTKKEFIDNVIAEVAISSSIANASESKARREARIDAGLPIIRGQGGGSGRGLPMNIDVHQRGKYIHGGRGRGLPPGSAKPTPTMKPVAPKHNTATPSTATRHPQSTVDKAASTLPARKAASKLPVPQSTKATKTKKELQCLRRDIRRDWKQRQEASSSSRTDSAVPEHAVDGASATTNPNQSTENGNSTMNTTVTSTSNDLYTLPPEWQAKVSPFNPGEKKWSSEEQFLIEARAHLGKMFGVHRFSLGKTNTNHDGDKAAFPRYVKIAYEYVTLKSCIMLT